MPPARPNLADRADEAALDVSIEIVDQPLRTRFRIADRSYDSFQTVVVRLFDGSLVGIGETAEILYRGETVEHILGAFRAVEPRLKRGLSRLHLQQLMPPCSARNALDCALWDLEAKRLGAAAWQLAGVPRPRALPTALTVGVDDADRMAAAATAVGPTATLKLKLAGDGHDDTRIRAVHDACPAATLIVDANRSFTLSSMLAIAPTLMDCGVTILEQPLPPVEEQALAELDYPVPIFGDESIETLADVPRAVGMFAGINIKLDKCGGLTEALQMAALARRLGLRVMVGNMGGTSLALAPAFVLAQIADVVDLDGPLFLETDVAPAARYEAGRVWCAEEVWGGKAGPRS